MLPKNEYNNMQRTRTRTRTALFTHVRGTHMSPKSTNSFVLWVNIKFAASGQCDPFRCIVTGCEERILLSTIFVSVSVSISVWLTDYLFCFPLFFSLLSVSLFSLQIVEGLRKANTRKWQRSKVRRANTLTGKKIYTIYKLDIIK